MRDLNSIKSVLIDRSKILRGAFVFNDKNLISASYGSHFWSVVAYRVYRWNFKGGKNHVGKLFT